MKKFLILLLILIGCGSPISNGEVVNKKFTAAHTESYMQPMTTMVGKTTMTTFIPQTRYVPDRYVAWVKGLTEKGKVKTITLHLTRTEYTHIMVGDSLFKQPETKFWKKKKLDNANSGW